MVILFVLDISILSWTTTILQWRIVFFRLDRYKTIPDFVMLSGWFTFFIADLRAIKCMNVFESLWPTLCISISLPYVKCQSVAPSPEFIHIKRREDELSQSLSGVHLTEAAYSRQGQVSRSLSHSQYNLLEKLSPPLRGGFWSSDCRCPFSRTTDCM